MHNSYRIIVFHYRTTIPVHSRFFAARPLGTPKHFPGKASAAIRRHADQPAAFPAAWQICTGITLRNMRQGAAPPSFPGNHKCRPREIRGRSLFNEVPWNVSGRISGKSHRCPVPRKKIRTTGAASYRAVPGQDAVQAYLPVDPENFQDEEVQSFRT